MNPPDYIVDSHVHLWNPSRLNYPWLVNVPPLNRAFLPDDYAAATKTANVGKMIFVECGCEPSQKRDEVKWATELAAREPRLRGIVAQVPLERGLAMRDELAALARNPLVKGVRRNLQGEAEMNFCLQPSFIAGVQALPEFGFSFDLCVTHQQLLSVIELVRRCPEVQFVLDHSGKPAVRDRQLDPWRQNLRALAALPNAACKISGLVTEAEPTRCRAVDLQPFVAHALACFGFGRVMFGGDWPVCNLATPFLNWLDSLNEILADETESDLTKLYQTNAERIYRV